MDGPKKAMEGWVVCFEKTRLCGVVQALGVTESGDIRKTPAAGASARTLPVCRILWQQNRGQWPPCVCLGRHLQERLLSPVFLEKTLFRNWLICPKVL